MPDRLHRRLHAATWVFALGSAVHIADHLRRGQGSVTDELHVTGTLALVLQVVVVTLVAAGHRLAPLAASAAGLPLAVGFAAAHWVPQWSALSDPVWEVGDLRWLSYAASTMEIVGALAVGLTGLAIVRQRGLADFGVGPVATGAPPGR
ncbi:MAG: hypothetical protein ACSLFP_13950 [Acidimicrobiales bacterium]